MHYTVKRSLAAAFALALFSQAASAQQADDFGLIDGSILFVDAESDSRCAAVNTFNADFFIRSCDRRLILLSGDDRETPYSVDEDFNVTRTDGTEAGRIRFATDNDGFRQVFWLSDRNFAEGPDLVLTYITDTDQLAVASIAGQDGEQVPLAPLNVSQTQCDPLVSFDGGDELLCARACGAGAAAPGLLLSLTLACAAARRRRR